MSDNYDNVLFGCGNPLLDIAADVTKEFAITKYKSEFGNAILANEENMGVYKDLVDNYKVDYTAGGATMNVFRVFAWMMKSKKSCNFMGTVSEDDFGKQLEKEANADGVNTHFEKSTKNGTGTCAVLNVGDERSLIANLGAANDYSESWFDTKEVQASVKAAKLYYVSGFFITVSPTTMVKLGKIAVETNKPFMINLSAIFIVKFFTKALQDVIPYADYIFANEDEAAAIDETMGWNVKDLVKIAEKTALLPKVNKKRPRVVVYTQRAEPIAVAIAQPDGSVESFEVKVTPVKKIVDSNGAGDSFCGGFLSGLALGLPLKECVTRGQKAATYMLGQRGVQFQGPCKLV